MEFHKTSLAAMTFALILSVGRVTRRAVTVLVAIALVAAACGSTNNSSSLDADAFGVDVTEEDVESLGIQASEADAGAINEFLESDLGVELQSLLALSATTLEDFECTAFLEQAATLADPVRNIGELIPDPTTSRIVGSHALNVERLIEDCTWNSDTLEERTALTAQSHQIVVTTLVERTSS